MKITGIIIPLSTGGELESLTDAGLFEVWFNVIKFLRDKCYDSYFVTILDLLDDVDMVKGSLLPGVVLLGVVENVDPALLVGILDGVPSSLTSDSVEPALDAGRDVLGVKLDLSGIDVFVVNVLEGVRRPYDAESD